MSETDQMITKRESGAKQELESTLTQIWMCFVLCCVPGKESQVWQKRSTIQRYYLEPKKKESSDFLLWSKVFLDKFIANRTIGQSLPAGFSKSKTNQYSHDQPTKKGPEKLSSMYWPCCQWRREPEGYAVSDATHRSQASEETSCVTVEEASPPQQTSHQRPCQLLAVPSYAVPSIYYKTDQHIKVLGWKSDLE